MAETVRVICRARPLNTREKKLGCKDVMKIDNNVGQKKALGEYQIGIVNPADEKAPPKSFTFDGVYGVGSTTEQIYADVGFPLVESVMEGYNGTVFAYGQTGCGKSFTMQGVNDPVSQKGIIPRAFEHIFEAIAVAESTKYLVHGSYCEIYNEEIRDLLGKNSKAKLDLKEHPEKGVYVQGLTSHAVNSVAECKVLMEKGWSQRAVGETLMNADSSRSHSIFSIYLEMCDGAGGGGGGGEENAEEKFKAAKLNLVDLAGSERQAKTGATGDRLKEATKINLSLSALGNVISALVDGRAKHIPYRDSKLTRLLQDSLGGNTKTLMVAALSPADNNYDETLSTLRYANRAKNIKNKPKINEDPKDALLREYQEEIKKLKAMLTSSGMGIIQQQPQQQQLVITETKVVEVEKIVTVENKEAIEREKQLLRDEYEAKLTQLRDEFEAEKNTNANIEEEVQKVQQRYEAKMADFILEEAKNQEQIQKQKAMEMMEKMREEIGRQQISQVESRESRIENGDRETGAYMDVEIGQQPEMDPLHCPSDPYPHPASSLPAPTSSPEPASPGGPEVGVVAPPANLIQAEAALQRLQELQMKMVGGEQKGDEEIKDKRKKKMSHAMKRKLKLMQAIEKMEDDGILIKTYENIHEELRHKTQKLEGKNVEVEKLEREITDLQAEFEFDRIDYLATIRQQDKQMKLLTSLLERVAPTVRRDCNYSNIDRIKADAMWDEESGEWTLPDLKVEKVSLPSTDSRTSESIMPGGRPLGPGGASLNGFPSSPRNTSNFEVDSAQHEDRYLQRLQRQNEEASDYFKPKRAEQLLGDMKSTKQSGFPSQNSNPKPSRDPWSVGGSVGVRDSHLPDPLGGATFHSHHRDVNPTSSTSLNAISSVNAISGHASPDGAATLSSNMARPGIKLEALPPRSTTAKRRKNKKPNALEPL